VESRPLFVPCFCENFYTEVMFGSSSEKVPLKSTTDDKAKQALSDLSSSLGGGDVENPYMRKGAPGAAPASVQQRVVKELKTNWWLWGSIVFAVLLVGSLVVFRENLYDSAKHGLPFLAVTEYAADSCALECKEQQESAQSKLTDKDTDGLAKLKEQYDMCYSKCVAQETNQVVAERAQFKKDEEELEKAVESNGDAKGKVADAKDKVVDAKDKVVETAKNATKAVG
jgi:hypothetical protein